MFDGSDPCWVPRVPIGQDKEWRMDRAVFGDGYEQRTLDGINALDTSFNLVWEDKPENDILAMDDYLSTRNGGGFPFQHPVTLVMYNCFCDKWTVSWSVRRVAKSTPTYVGTLTATFKVANGVDVEAVTS